MEQKEKDSTEFSRKFRDARGRKESGNGEQLLSGMERTWARGERLHTPKAKCQACLGESHEWGRGGREMSCALSV